MNQQANTSSRRFRFRLRTLIVAMAFVALMLVGGRYLYLWYTSIPLAESVAAFNSRASTDPVGKHEPPITEDEIISAIESQLPTLDASPQVKAIYSHIARARRLPRGATLDSITGYRRGKDERFTVWWINLEIMTGPKSGYGIRVRETDNPVAAGDAKPVRR